MTPIFATVDYYILAFSAITVVVTIWMGFRSAKTSKTASDFFVAGRSVSVGWNASAISGEYLSAASFMGIAGMVMSSGYDALWYPVCYACGYLFLLLFIAGPLRRFGAYTIPDFAEGRYDSPLFRKIAVCFVLFIGFFYTMPQMKGAGTTLGYIFDKVDLRGVLPDFLLAHDSSGAALIGLPYWVGVLLVGAVITLNVALGGMKGITLVQAFQYWAKMFAISVPIFVLMAVYGHYGKQLEINAPTTTKPAAKYDAALVEKTYSLSTVDGILNKDAKWLMNEGPTRAHLTKINIWTNPTSMTLDTLLHQYSYWFKGMNSFKRYVAPELSSFGPIIISQPQPMTFDEFTAHVQSVLVSNGITFVRVADNAIKVYPTDKAAKFEAVPVEEEIVSLTSRKPLPEKAPADATWLSPFGPLTTKAAKAAATPRTVSDFELISGDKGIASKVAVLGQVIYAPHVLGQIERLKATFKRPAPQSWRTMIPATSSNVMVHMPAPLLAYAAALGKPVLWQTNMAVQPFVMDVAHTVQTTDAEMAARIESALRSNGVAFVMTPHDAVIAVHATELAKLRAESGTKPAAIPQTSVRPYALLSTYSLIIALICGTAGLPHILVRFYTNPDGGAAKRTTMWVMILIGIFYVFPPVFGVMGRNLMPELYTGLSGIKGTDQVVLKLPTLLNEKFGVLGSILSGITCAGAFAAFMSTFSGLLVSMTGALAHDVYGRMLRPKSTPEQRMRMFKFAAVLIGFVSILLGSLVEPLEINFMVGQAFAIAAASYFPLLFMSVWWRGMTMRGAAVGMLTGGLCALVAATLTNVSNLALDKGPMGKIFSGFAGMNDFWAQHPLLRILCEQPAIWTVPLAITLMIVVSKATRKDVPSDVRMKMLVLHAPEKLGLKQEYIQEHQAGH